MLTGIELASFGIAMYVGGIASCYLAILFGCWVGDEHLSPEELAGYDRYMETSCDVRAAGQKQKQSVRDIRTGDVTSVEENAPVAS